MIAAFLVAILPLIATPGASLALLTQHVTAHGLRRAIPVIAGTVTGIYTHALLAVLGLSAVVMHSSQAFFVVRVAGGLYLLCLGIWTWRTARQTRSAANLLQPAYLQALLGNVLNPKAASIYLTLVPQFLDPDRALTPQIAVLATAHALLMIVWLAGWTAILVRTGQTLSSMGWAVAIRRAAAAVLIYLGVRALAA
jgi:threonine/homoserine/homoserine lactone efflux protein